MEAEILGLKLLKDGLIEEVESVSGSERDEERRRYYRLTGLGTRVVNAELNRFRAILRSAKGKKLVQSSGALA